MTKKELKMLIKECLKEMLFEEKGVLSNVINEVLESSAASSKSASINEKKDNTRDMILKMHKAGGDLFSSPLQEQKPVAKSLTTVKNPIVKQVVESFGGLNPFDDITSLND